MGGDRGRSRGSSLWRGARAAALSLAVLASMVVATTPASAGTRITAAAAAGEPVVLVYGYLGRPADMDTMAAALNAAGHKPYIVTLPGQRNETNAAEIKRVVEGASAENGGAKVGLVGHSMGGLSARWYLAKLGGTAHVADYVSMGTSQRGFLGACILLDDGREMCPNSDFLRQLNAGDETPGAVRYTTLHSSQDSSKDERPLVGVACNAVVGDVGHDKEPSSREFIEAVKTALAGGCPR